MNNRLALVARFYFPRLKKQIIAYPIISLLLGSGTIVSILSGSEILLMLALIIDVFLISVMIEYGPLAFAFRSCPEIETGLPATAGQQSLFIIAYTFIGIPLMILLPITLVEIGLIDTGLVSNNITDELKEIERVLSGKLGFLTIACGLLQYLVPMAVCLYAVMRHTRKRLLHGIIWTLVANVMFAIFGFIVGAISAFKSGFEDGWNGVEANPDNVVPGLTANILSMMDCLGVILIICLIFAIYMTCRTIKQRQV